MKSIDLLCEEIRQMPSEDFVVTLSKYVMKAMSACSVYAQGDEEAALQALGMLSYGALLADGKISGGEFDYVYAGLKTAMGPDFDMDACMNMVDEMVKLADDMKAVATEMAEEYLSLWDEDDKESVVMFCIALCNIDGEISEAEKEWLKDLAYSAGV